MGSNILLQWLSAYDKQKISKQVINHASENIALSKTELKFKKPSQLRRKFCNPLLNYGHLEYADKNERFYYVSPPTLLEINGLFTLYIGARNQYYIDLWKNELGGDLFEDESELITCWKNNVISEINHPEIMKWHQSFADIDLILSKLPVLSFNSISSNSIFEIQEEKMKKFDIKSRNWKAQEINSPGVYRYYDDYPPSARPWCWYNQNDDGRLFYKKLDTSEAVSVALCSYSADLKKIKIYYSIDTKELKIILPKRVFLPLMLSRPLCWLSAGSGKKRLNNCFNNIPLNTANQVSRILKTKLDIN